jgi:hypothetical protein
MTQLKSKQKVTKLNEVKLNDVMREFEFSFWKTEEDTPDFYLFNLPNDNVYIVLIKDNKLVFEMVSEKGLGDTLYSKSFKSIKSLRNQLCLAL